MISTLKSALGDLRERLLGLPRAGKRAVLVATDLVVLLLVMFGVVWLRRFALVETTPLGYALMALAPVIAVSTFAWLGLYRLVTRFIGHRGNLRIAAGVALATLIWALLVFMTGQQGIPRSSIVLFWLIGTGLVVASRQSAVSLLGKSGARQPEEPRNFERKRVLIYGAGTNGIGLLDAVRRDSTREVAGFVDPDSSLWGQYAGGVKVYRPDKTVALIERR